MNIEDAKQRRQELEQTLVVADYSPKIWFKSGLWRCRIDGGLFDYGVVGAGGTIGEAYSAFAAEDAQRRGAGRAMVAAYSASRRSWWNRIFG